MRQTPLRKESCENGFHWYRAWLLLPETPGTVHVERQQVLSTRSGCRWVLRRMKPAIRHYGTPLSMGQIRRAAPDRVALEVRAICLKAIQKARSVFHFSESGIEHWVFLLFHALRPLVRCCHSNSRSTSFGCWNALPNLWILHTPAASFTAS